jgi:hypothetical protein
LLEILHCFEKHSSLLRQIKNYKNKVLQRWFRERNIIVVVASESNYPLPLCSPGVDVKKLFSSSLTVGENKLERLYLV